MPEPVGWHTPEPFRRDLAEHRMRPEWSWLAECAVVGPPRQRAAALIAAGQAALLGSGAATFTLVLADGWHNDPATVAAVEWRRAAVRRICLTDELEHLRFEWTPSAAVPAGSGRLTFSTDTTNAPMATAFAAAGYRVTEKRLVFSAPSSA